MLHTKYKNTDFRADFIGWLWAASPTHFHIFRMAKTEKTQEQENEKEMSFFDHLSDLRKRIFYMVIGLVIACLAAAFIVDFLMEVVLLAPATDAKPPLKLQNIRPFGQTLLYFKVLLFTGFILSIPNTLYQIWKFVAPGLYEHERSWVRRITILTTFCFFTGIVFAYYVMVPTMLGVAASFGSQQIENSIEIGEYFSFMTMTLLSAGLIFELPMISFVLARIGILTTQFMTKYRRHAIIIILILAAALTPSTDPISQLVLAGPLWVLYEISIIVVRATQKKKEEGND